MAEVVLKGIYKHFAKTEFLKNIDIEIPNNSFYVLTGPTGSGKTLILRIIAGLEDINKGDIFIDNSSIKNESPKKRDVAMVFQNFALYPNMTVYDNMAFGLKNRGFRRREVFSRVCEAAELLSIEHILGKYPHQLLTEEKQRTAIGRTIVRKPKIFLFDEPLSNIALPSREQLMLELKILHKKLKTTIIYATRNKAEAMSLGEKICVLKDGGIQQIADNAILYENPANKFVAEFITTPLMNFFSIDVLRKPNGVICFNEGRFELLLTEGLKEKFNIFLGQKLLLAIRPEHIYDKAICDIPFKDSYSLKAKIEIIEPLGSKKYLHLNTGKNKFIMETNRTKEVIEGQEIELVIDYSKMHVFSISDGSRII